MTVTLRRSPRRRALAVSAALGLLLSSITVLSTPALGDSPSEECASADPEWNGDFWKIEEEDGILGEIETNVAGAISLATDGSWTNTNEDPVFRVVLKIDDAEDQVLSGLWETGEGGLIDTTLDGLEHVTFCSTSEVVVDAVPTTTTIPTTTTSAEQTTTTSAGPTTTTSLGPTSTTPAEPTTTTSQGASTADTPFPDEPAPNAPAQPASEGAQAVESDEEAAGASSDSNEANGPKSSPPDSDRDTTVGGLTDERSGDPPALGQASMPNAEIDSNPSSQDWLALQDLAILSALIAGIGVLILIDRGKLDFRRLLKNSHVGKRWR